jgi:hypothetical protein
MGSFASCRRFEAIDLETREGADLLGAYAA